MAELRKKIAAFKKYHKFGIYDILEQGQNIQIFENNLTQVFSLCVRVVNYCKPRFYRQILKLWELILLEKSFSVELMLKWDFNFNDGVKLQKSDWMMILFVFYNSSYNF